MLLYGAGTDVIQFWIACKSIVKPLLTDFFNDYLIIINHYLNYYQPMDHHFSSWFEMIVGFVNESISVQNIARIVEIFRSWDFKFDPK